jgi:uncharacterized protein YndB with AHSA1/START domain
MKTELQFDFIVDTPNSTMTIVREFAAGRQTVWNCYTQSALLDQWFAPEPLTTKTASMDFSPGGHWLYAMVAPEGAEYWGRTDFLTITPIAAYTALDGFCDNTGTLVPGMPRARWDVRFSEAGTRLTSVKTVVLYDSPSDLEKVIAMGMKEGMSSTLQRLDGLLLTLSAKE